MPAVVRLLPYLEQLQDGHDDVVDVAEAGGLGALGVVHAACGGREGGRERRVVQAEEEPKGGGCGVQKAAHWFALLQQRRDVGRQVLVRCDRQLSRRW